MTQAVKTAQTLRLGRRMLLSQAGDTKAVLSVKEMKQTASDMLTTQDLCLGILTTARPIKRSVLITVLLFIQSKEVFDGSQHGIYVGNGEVVFSSADCGYVTKEVVSNGSWTSWCTYEGIEYPQEVTDAIESLNENSSSEN